MLRRFSNFWSSGPDARAILILALLAVLSLPGVTTRLYAADEVEAFAYLRSLWFDGDVSFDNEYRHLFESGVIPDEGFKLTFMDPVTETGLRRNFSTIGPAILWSPFYVAADAGVDIARALGSSVADDGYSRPYVAAVCYASTCYGWLALVLSLLIARRLLAMTGEVRTWPAVAATWATWLGTPLLFYMYVSPPFTHAVSAFTAALFVWVWLSVRERWSAGGTALLCAVAALMAMVREQDAFMVVGPAFDFGLTWLRRRDVRMIRSAALGVMTAVVVYLPQALAYLALNGHLGPSSLVGRKMTWTAPHALAVVFSPEHGWLLWTPLVALAAAGWVLMLMRRSIGGPDHDAARAVRRIGICLWLTVLSQVYIAGSVESWTLAGAFGQRRLVSVTFAVVIGLAFLLATPRARVAKAVTAGVIAAGIWWNIGLMIQFGAGLMDRQRLDLARNSYNTLVVVPQRLPEIAYRYVFERQRFYHPAPEPAREQ